MLLAQIYYFLFIYKSHHTVAWPLWKLHAVSDVLSGIFDLQSLSISAQNGKEAGKGGEIRGKSIGKPRERERESSVISHREALHV